MELAKQVWEKNKTNPWQPFSPTDGEEVYRNTKISFSATKCGGMRSVICGFPGKTPDHRLTHLNG